MLFRIKKQHFIVSLCVFSVVELGFLAWFALSGTDTVLSSSKEMVISVDCSVLSDKIAFQLDSGLSVESVAKIEEGSAVFKCRVP